MALTDLQRKRLIEDVNRLNINVVLKYFLSGDITFDDVPNISDDRRSFLEEHLPSPAQMEWDALLPSLAEVSQSTLQKLEAYIRKYEGTRPNGNHVDEARAKYVEIEDRIPTPAGMEWEALKPSLANVSQSTLQAVEAYIRKYEGTRPRGNRVDEARAKKKELEAELREMSRKQEDAEWNTVDPFSMTSLVGHLGKYPQSAHRDEIDDSVWNIVNKENVQELQNYKTLFPNGRHTTEVNSILNAIVEWDRVKNSGDILVVFRYIHDNPKSPFLNNANILLMGMKQREMELMRTSPNSYEVTRLMELIKCGIFSDDELIRQGVMTANVLNTLRHTDITNDLPDINSAIKSSYPECREGYTDVYFFGIPSTGKTCVLMGMSRSPSLQINLASGGGDYAAALQQYTDVGITVPRTPGSFVTTLEATISNINSNVEHRINLVEMSGEEFAFEIANNTEHNFTFEEMGTGATELLKNDNRKVFFLIIDPTANVVRINREIVEYNEETGEKQTRLERGVVNQRTLLQKFVNIFQNPSNSEIMRKVDSLHIIMTKADMLGSQLERDDKALSVFNSLYANGILQPIISLCQQYNINSNNNYRPKLFTFSLGTFYVGGLYEYDQTDSDKLVSAIENATGAIRKKSFWDKVKETLN